MSSTRRSAPPATHAAGRYVKEKLSAYKYPRRIEVLDELPRGPTGKVLRDALVVDLR